jgi:hypothetical protein
MGWAGLPSAFVYLCATAANRGCTYGAARWAHSTANSRSRIISLRSSQPVALAAFPIWRPSHAARSVAARARPGLHSMSQGPDRLKVSNTGFWVVPDRSRDAFSVFTGDPIAHALRHVRHLVTLTPGYRARSHQGDEACTEEPAGSVRATRIGSSDSDIRYGNRFVKRGCCKKSETARGYARAVCCLDIQERDGHCQANRHPSFIRSQHDCKRGSQRDCKRSLRGDSS